VSWRADTYIKNDILSIEESIVNHVEYTMARSRYKFDDQEAYMATAYSLRDRLIESWNDTQAYFKWADGNNRLMCSYQSCLPQISCGAERQMTASRKHRGRPAPATDHCGL
jgi:glucan phosphorylase